MPTAKKKTKKPVKHVYQDLPTPTLDTLETWKKELAECFGPESILRFKVLQFKIAQFENACDLAEVPLPKHEDDNRAAEISLERWRIQRAHEKRASILYETTISPRFNKIDTCSKCNVELCVDKEIAKSVCPKCGQCTRPFPSHIFDVGEDCDTSNSLPPQAPPTKAHQVSKHLQQFAQGFPMTPAAIKTTIASDLAKLHVSDPLAVTTARVQNVFKAHSEIPNVYKSAPTRVAREMINMAIPEFTNVQLQEMHEGEGKEVPAIMKLQVSAKRKR